MIRSFVYYLLSFLNFRVSYFEASPHATGIIDQTPSEELRRGLMLLSKVIRKLNT